MSLMLHLLLFLNFRLRINFIFLSALLIGFYWYSVNKLGGENVNFSILLAKSDKVGGVYQDSLSLLVTLDVEGGVYKILFNYWWKLIK